ncbi:MAG: hypothetical protein AB1898_16935 [Acidobacteriota bacterium]
MNILYYGKEEPLPTAQRLESGSLNVTLEEGDLLSVCWGRYEILRRVHVAVRDQNWRTIPPRLSELEVHSNGKGFRVSYQAHHRQEDIDFVWTASIQGMRDGTLTFRMDGQARSTFLRNRIGFCLLHPAREYAGRVFAVQQDDGSWVQGVFPKQIANKQPLVGTERMKSLTFEVVSGLRAAIQFDGDLFQMEDQRNWTDATLKTFCTPLSRPFPVEIRQGTRISQAITLKVTESRTIEHVAVEEKRKVLSISKQAGATLPRIGLGMSSHGQPLTELEISRLKALDLSHLRVDLWLSDPSYRTILARAAAQARQVGVALEAALFLSNSAERELSLLSEELCRLHPPVSTWLVFHADEKVTSQRWVRLTRQLLRPWNPRALFGAGTNAYFYQLNQKRPAWEDLDVFCYSIHPQEHASDNRSLVESLEIQGETVRNARELVQGVPAAISPVTLKPRFNPNATVASPAPLPGELPPEVDARQMSLFGAAWTLGSLKSLAENGVFSVTYYETSGWRGVMERESGSPLPDRFRSFPGCVFPLYHIFADIAAFQHGQVLAANASDPLTVTGLALVRDGRKRVLLANLTREIQAVRVEGVAGDLRIAELNEASVTQAMTSPDKFRVVPGYSLQATRGMVELTLLPYATARIDEQSTTVEEGFVV